MPVIREAVEVFFADDDVVQDPDPHELPGLAEAARHFKVFGTGGGVAGGVVVQEDDGRGGLAHRDVKDLTRVDDALNA